MKKANNKNIETMGGLEWEMRPGGMLVQKRNLDNNSLKNHNTSKPTIPTIKISVKFGSFTHEIHINSHATFGELKKMLGGATGVNPQDQKLIFKEKERESKAFLDVSGVKDGSMVVLIQEKRTIESRENNNSSMEKAMKSVAEVTIKVDKLVAQVVAMESVICKGGRVAEKELLTLIELFMSQLIKLDGIVAHGDVKLKRKMQVTRIQKYMENVDRLKAENARPMRHGGLMVSQAQQQQQRQHTNFSTRQIKLF